MIQLISLCSEVERFARVKIDSPIFRKEIHYVQHRIKGNTVQETWLTVILLVRMM